MISDEDTFCPDCGDRKIYMGGLHRMGCANPACRINNVDWSRPLEPSGPVRLPTREELLADARRGLWAPIASLPQDRPVIITRVVPSTGQWLIQRLAPGHPPFIHGQPVSHWCEDLLGSPAA